MKRLLIVPVLALLAGCGGGSSSSNNNVTPVTPTRADLIGTWKYTSLQASGGNVVGCPGGLLGTGNTVVLICGANDIVTYNADNTFTSTRTATDGITITHPAGTWGLSGSTLTRTTVGSNAGATDSFSITLSTDGKTHTETASPYTITFAKQ